MSSTMERRLAVPRHGGRSRIVALTLAYALASAFGYPADPPPVGNRDSIARTGRNEARETAPASEGERIVRGHTAVFARPPRNVPTNLMPDGPLLGNGDLGVVLSGPPEEQRFHIGKNDFWYSEMGMAWCDGNTLGIHHIFPAGAIGLGSDPKLLSVSRDTIDAMSRWHDQNGFSSWYTACARVGHDPKTILEKLRVECDNRSYPSLILYYGGGGIENVAGFLAVNEMLMQSHEGAIRLFPVWPKELDARFGDLRAVGAFLVSAELKGGKLSDARIRSEKGRDCTVVNPWPGRAVALTRDGQPAETVTGDRFTFTTRPMETIALRARQGPIEHDRVREGPREPGSDPTGE
jgi:hypothetical protein